MSTLSISFHLTFFIFISAKLGKYCLFHPLFFVFFFRILFTLLNFSVDDGGQDCILKIGYNVI